MKTIHILAVVGVAAVGLAVYAFTKSETPANAVVVDDVSLDTFAQCLTDAGVKFYGAFWCPHCQDQKALFGDSENIPYIECSSPDGQAQLEICTNENIVGYPTWRFADGSELPGVQSLEDLSTKSSCSLSS